MKMKASNQKEKTATSLWTMLTLEVIGTPRARTRLTKDFDLLSFSIYQLIVCFQSRGKISRRKSNPGRGRRAKYESEEGSEEEDDDYRPRSTKKRGAGARKRKRRDSDDEEDDDDGDDDDYGVSRKKGNKHFV